MSFDAKRIKIFKGTTSIYPGTNNAVKIDYISSDNTVIEAVLKKQEADLLMFLKLKIGSKLRDSEMKELQQLIEEYGDSRYDEGNFDATYEG